MKSQAEARSGTLPKRGKRHPLLYQQRFNEMVFWPTILTIALCITLLIRAVPEFQAYIIVILFGCGAILILTFLFRLRAYAQCRTSELWIQLPFFHIVIPYRAIKTTRPTDLYRLFFPYQLRWTQRQFLKPLLGRTVVVIELEQPPAERRPLRLWMSPFMLSPDTDGLVLAVRDWIAMRGEVDEFKARSYHAAPRS
jgi:hypothetical protein